MQKYTRSSRPTSRGSSVETESDVGVSSAVCEDVGRPTIPEPIRRWHSFHSRRSSFGHSAAPSHLALVTGAVPPPVVAPVSKPAARFLSPPPLTPRRRFSVWYLDFTAPSDPRQRLLCIRLSAHRLGLESVLQSAGSIKRPAAFPPYKPISISCLYFTTIYFNLPIGNFPGLNRIFPLFIFSFGKRSGVSIRRPNECLILEPSEMLVVSSVSSKKIF